MLLRNKIFFFSLLCNNTKRVYIHIHLGSSSFLSYCNLQQHKGTQFFLCLRLKYIVPLFVIFFLFVISLFFFCFMLSFSSVYKHVTWSVSSAPCNYFLSLPSTHTFDYFLFVIIRIVFPFPIYRLATIYFLFLFILLQLPSHFVLYHRSHILLFLLISYFLLFNIYQSYIIFLLQFFLVSLIILSYPLQQT